MRFPVLVMVEDAILDVDMSASPATRVEASGDTELDFLLLVGDKFDCAEFALVVLDA